MIGSARVAIIGAGHVGATTAYALMLRALVGEIVLIDENEARAEAEAADLMDANALARPAHIWSGGYEDAAAASIAIITAGAATKGEESRLSLASRSAEIVDECSARLMAANFEGIILVASNPVDLMAMATLQRTALSPGRVIGTGTLLDTSRFQQLLATRLDIAPSSIEAMVLGEHGDSQVSCFSTVRAGGVGLEELSPDFGDVQKAEVAERVETSAYRIIGGKGYTSFGIATATVRICEAILRDERAVLPVSTLLTGQLGIDGVYLSLPCLLGSKGVEAVLTPSLSADERSALVHSADLLRSEFEKLKLPAGISSEFLGN